MDADALLLNTFGSTAAAVIVGLAGVVLGGIFTHAVMNVNPRRLDYIGFLRRRNDEQGYPEFSFEERIDKLEGRTRLVLGSDQVYFYGAPGDHRSANHAKPLSGKNEVLNRYRYLLAQDAFLEGRTGDVSRLLTAPAVLPQGPEDPHYAKRLIAEDSDSVLGWNRARFRKEKFAAEADHAMWREHDALLASPDETANFSYRCHVAIKTKGSVLVRPLTAVEENILAAKGLSNLAEDEQGRARSANEVVDILQDLQKDIEAYYLDRNISWARKSVLGTSPHPEPIRN